MRQVTNVYIYAYGSEKFTLSWCEKSTLSLSCIIYSGCVLESRDVCTCATYAHVHTHPRNSLCPWAASHTVDLCMNESHEWQTYAHMHTDPRNSLCSTSLNYPNFHLALPPKNKQVAREVFIFISMCDNRHQDGGNQDYPILRVRENPINKKEDPLAFEGRSSCIWRKILLHLKEDPLAFDRREDRSCNSITICWSGHQDDGNSDYHI